MLANGGDPEAGTLSDAAALPTQGLSPILLLQLFLTAVIVVVIVKSRAAGCRGEVQGTAYTITTCIINIIGLALCVDQFYMDWTCVNGDLVFNNFLLVDKLVSCLKLYVTGYDAVHTKGSEMFGCVCLLGCFLHWFAILYRLARNHRTWVRTRVLGMLSIMAAGVSLLCRGMVIHNVWNTDVVPAIVIFLVSVDGILLIRAQIKKTGGNEQTLRDMVIKLVETTISIIRLVDLKGQTHKPWDAGEILHLVGSSLSVLIGICLLGFMVYNVRISVISKLIEWRGKIILVFTEDENDNAEEQAAEEGVGDVEREVLD